jgi:MarR family transcriptional regulator, organic hydroperoxide resistance regulator
MSRSSANKRAVAAAAWRSIMDFIIATAPERNRAIGESGLTPNDARSLLTLRHTPGRTMGSLADEWKCDASTATWIVDRLEAKGLAERRPHATDRRVKLVALTPFGLRALAKQSEKSYVPPRELLELDVVDLLALRKAVAKLPAGKSRRLGKSSMRLPG